MKTKSYTIEDIKKLPCMKMERHITNTKGVISKDDKPWQIEIQKDIDAKNWLRHQLLEELKGEGKK